MRPLKAAIFTIALGSLLAWLYCILRIFTAGNIQFFGPFIEGIPVSFLEVSIASFIIFLTAIFCYLVLEEA